MRNDEICYLSAIELVSAIRAKDLSPVEITEAVLERIERLNPVLNAFCTSMADEARAAARRAEEAVMRGEELGPLHGVPVSIKDNLYVKGVRTTFGSKLLEHNVIEDDDSRTNASPAVSNGQLLLRTDRALYCIGRK